MGNIAFGVVVGLILSPLTILLYNIFPSSWLCDYNEVPDEHFHKNRKINSLPLACALAGIYALTAGVIVMQMGVVYAITLSIFELLLSLIVIADIKTQIVPDQLVLGILVVGVAVVMLDLIGRFRVFHNNIWSALVGAVIGFSFFFLVGLIGNLVTKQNTMGFGDIKLLAAIGFLVGTRGVITIIALTLLIALIVFSALIIMKKLARDEQVAFAPYICAAAVVYLVLQTPIDALVDSYLAMF